MIRNILTYFTAALILTGVASCHNDRFKVKGEIYGGEGKSMSLEKSDYNGRWTSLDSVKIGKTGSFSVSFPAPASPDIYRLALDGKFVYFPVDSTESLTLTSSFDDFGRNYTLTGSRNAELMGEFDKEVGSLNLKMDADSLDNFKRYIYSKYMKDFPGSIVSFYILTKTIEGQPIYSPRNTKDAKYFGAVATGYKTQRPNDPHTALLEQTTLTAMKQKNSEAGNYRTIEANEIAILDLELQDNEGKMVKLSDVTGKGKPVVVIFSLLTHQDSPALNYELAQIYNRRNGGVEFYNVSLDPDQYAWRESAKNLPWINVYAPAQMNSEAARIYNVTELPAFFIYNSDGELTMRPRDIRELESNLK